MLLKIIAAVGALAAVSPVLMTHYPRMTGTLPMWHLGVPFGMTQEDLPDLRGKIAVVTGANSGLGKGTAQLLVAKGATVYGTCRSQARCAEAATEIGGDFRPMQLDLSSLASVDAFAADFMKREKQIDYLALNAGVMAPPFGMTEDGLETQFGVNHLAHHKLTQLLLPLVVAAAPGSRIVSVSSVAHYHNALTPSGNGMPLTLDEVNDEANYTPVVWYGYSKLANLLFGQELSARVKDQGVYVNVIHPGGVTGNLTRHVLNYEAHGDGGIMKRIDDALQSILYWDVPTASLTLLYPLVSPEVERGEGIHGKYFVPIARVMSTSTDATNSTLQKEFWEFSERLIAMWDKDHGAFKHHQNAQGA